MTPVAEAYGLHAAARWDELVDRYAPLVKRIAHHLRARLPESVQAEDLIQAGMIGLLEAARKFEDNRGASFETYAGIRIRGAMLDEIRRGDWAPRSVHRDARKVAVAIATANHQPPFLPPPPPPPPPMHLPPPRGNLGGPSGLLTSVVAATSTRPSHWR